MHMVHPGLTSVNTSLKKKKRSVAQQRKIDEHNNWLKQQGVHLDQLASKSTKGNKPLTHKVSADKSGPQCNNGFALGGAKKSVFDSQWQKTYEDDPLMAEREAIALKKAEELKANLMPLYNKGPVQVRTAGMSMKDGNGRGKN